MAGSSGGTGPLDNITKRISSLQLSNRQKSRQHKFKKINEVYSSVNIVIRIVSHTCKYNVDN